MSEQVFTVKGEPIMDKSVFDVAEQIEELANRLKGNLKPNERRSCADTIMHLAADIAVTE